ncbi:MaoC family dehydratase [Rhodococcus sp. ABRD24]|uniref:MaoC family dehydratase n=1 Tax=Rhodococcus sp. ABRD24 TaxID=2507582 RepID=UPI001A9545BA|nr:MaoC family dehydratase [Rhodococcus sp. ABRD24]
MVLPTFATTLLARERQPPFGDFDPAHLLHSHQSLTLHGPLPTTGTATSTSRLTALYDRGHNALAVIDSTCVDPRTGGPLAELRTGLTIRREGGFGGEPGRDDPWDRPDSEPDRVIDYCTAPNQALLYRLSGDLNPLHSDPNVAARLGLRSPLLHGLCTFGFAGRALLHALCGGDPARFGTISARFTAPVFPGQTLSVRIWERGEDALFQVHTNRGIVMDAGQFTQPG